MLSKSICLNKHASGLILNSLASSVADSACLPVVGSLQQKEGAIDQCSFNFLGKLLCLGLLKLMALRGAALTLLLDAFHMQSWSVGASGMLSFNSMYTANLIKSAATWLHVDARPATQEQFPSLIQPSLWIHTHTRYGILFMPCLWLGNTWK